MPLVDLVGLRLMRPRTRLPPFLIFLVLTGLVLVWPLCARSDDRGEGTETVPARTSATPSVGYAVNARFSSLPGTLAEITFLADYDVVNRDCVPVDYDRALGGVRLMPSHRLTLPSDQSSDGSYSTLVFEDALVDEDYFGLGVCKWRLGSLTVHFRSPATLFIGGLGREELRRGGETVDHYLVKDFHERPAVGDWVFGEKPGHYIQSAGPQFTLTFRSEPLK